MRQESYHFHSLHGRVVLQSCEMNQQLRVLGYSLKQGITHSYGMLEAHVGEYGKKLQQHV